MKSINKIYKVGNSCSITVNSYVMEKLKLKEGDMVLVDFIKKEE